MLYPFIVPIFLLSGEEKHLPRLDNNDNIHALIYRSLFGSTSRENNKNYKDYYRNKRNYNKNICGLFNKATSADTINTIKRLSENTSLEHINDFLFLCYMYSIEMNGNMVKECEEFKYRELTGKLKESDYDLIIKFYKIAVCAADGAPSVSDEEAAEISDKIRKCRKNVKEHNVHPNYYDLLLALSDYFSEHSRSVTFFDLVKLTIIDPETLSLWSGDERPHFLDNYKNSVGEIVIAPNWFFDEELKNTKHKDYLPRLLSRINSLNSIDLNYLEQHLKNLFGICDDNDKDFIELCQQLLTDTYTKLLSTQANEKITNDLTSVRSRILTLTPVSGLSKEQCNVRKKFLSESLIRLTAVILSNWKNFELGLIYEDFEYEMRISNCLDRNGDSLIQLLNNYDFVGKMMEESPSCIQYFDEKYAKPFMTIISGKTVRDTLLAEPNKYKNIFSLYRRWLAYKKYSIYHRCNISLRGDILCHKICKDYLNKIPLDSNATQPFEVLDNCGLVRWFGLRLANMSDYDNILKLNFQEFSRKVFVSSPQCELEFGLEHKTIYVIEEETTHKIAAMMIIVKIESENKLMAMENVYGTATLAKNYIREGFAPFVIFDAVIVSPEFRGLGFQKLGLILAEYLCRVIDGKFVCATVSPTNLASSRNFKLCEYKSIQTVYYPSRETEETPGRRYKEPTNYYKAHQEECDNESISYEIAEFLSNNEISEKDYRQERVAVRAFVVQEIS